LFIWEGHLGFFRRNIIVSIGMGVNGGVLLVRTGNIPDTLKRAICGAGDVHKIDYLPFLEIDCKLRKDIGDSFCQQVFQVIGLTAVRPRAPVVRIRAII